MDVRWGRGGDDGAVAGDYPLPPAWQELKEQVIHLAQFGGAMQVIEGEAGAGKTTFASWLCADPAAPELARVTVDEQTNGYELFYQLLAKLGLRPQASASLGELMVALRGYVQSLQREGARTAVIIDDAHFIADADLGALTSILDGGDESGCGLHLIMMAQPGLVERIDRLQVLSVAVHDMVLPPLPPTGTTAVSNQRLPREASANAETASQKAREPGGVAREKSGEGARFAASGPESSTAQRQALPISARGWPIAHIVALLFLCCILIWAFVAQKPEPVPAVVTLDIDELMQRGGDDGAALPAAAEPVGSPPETAAIAVEQPAPAGDVTAADRPQGISTQPRSEVLQSNQAPAETTNTTQPVAPETAPVSRSGNDAAPTELPSPVAESATNSATAAAPRQASGAVGEELIIASEAQLLRHPGHAYVLQLMASVAPDSLLAFVAKQPNRQHLAVYRARRDGRLMHILVEGFYADKAAASAAIANLPAEQRKSGPWPKRIEQIHRDIAEFKHN